MLDYHLHLWDHGTPGRPVRVEQLRAYCERAAEAGVTEIALTEHLFRFREADAALRGWWDDDPSPALRAAMAGYWDEHVSADLDQYVTATEEARAAGLPVVVGLEVDFYEGRMDKVAALLDGYPFDVLLGSIHWIGAWGFDCLDVPEMMREWKTRDVDDVWEAYTRHVEELAASGVCDVLAHPDLAKVAGHRPSASDEFYDRMAEAARASGMSAEVSSAGLRKPCNEVYPARDLLSRFHDAGVTVTTASDAHGLDHVALHSAELKSLLTAAGYSSLSAFRARKPHEVAL